MLYFEISPETFTFTTEKRPTTTRFLWFSVSGDVHKALKTFLFTTLVSC